jgi:hypothetical protein
MDVVDLLSELVAIDSTTAPSPRRGGERAMATALDGLLVGLGFTVTQHEVTPGRPNVVGVRPSPGAPTICSRRTSTRPDPTRLVLTRTVDRLGGGGRAIAGRWRPCSPAIDQVTPGRAGRSRRSSWPDRSTRRPA